MSIWTVAVQHTEEAYGCPTDMLVKFNNYPTSLIEDYKDKYDYVQYCIYISVKEHKAYRLINAREVEVVDYEPDVLPLVTINYCDPVFGRKTTSIVEELNGIQTQIDMINQKIAAAAQLTPANSIYVLEGSSLDAEKLTNKSGEVYQIKLPPGMNSLPIQNINPAPFDPMWQSMLDHYIKIAFETIGLSQLSATGKKPSGVDSGVALSTLEDVESDRFETQLNAYIKMYTDIAKMYVNVLPANADIVPISQNTSPLKWKDLLKEQGLFKVQYSAATFLSKQPSEKIKQISQLSQAGLKWFNGKKIATSYPNILRNFMKKNNINADIHVITGSVEISPGIGLADGIFDIVSSGSTLVSNNLAEVEVAMKSEALLIGNWKMDDEKHQILNEMLFRFEAVRSAQDKISLKFV